MAIRTNISTSVPIVGTISVPAYVKVAQVSGNADNMNAVIQAFTDDDSRELVDTKTLSFVPTLEGQNFIVQAYMVLKSQPEYANHIDC